MDQLGRVSAALGIRYLIKYANKPDQECLDVLRDRVDEIKLWCLITLFTNNMDAVWEKVPDFIYEELFLMKKIETTRGEIVYGRGYHSRSSLGFKEQFKLIRDKLAHQDFIYQDKMIYIDDHYDTRFDLLWLEALVLSTISNGKNDFVKGMNDVAIFSIIPQSIARCYDFKDLWNLGFIQFYQITLLNGNQNTWANYFKDTGINSKRYTFLLIFNSVKYKLNHYQNRLDLSFDEAIERLNHIFREVEDYFGKFIHLELIHPSINEELFIDQDFQEMSFSGKLLYLINKVKMGDPIFYNSIIVINLLKILNQLDHLSKDNLYILRDAKNFLVKVYANILFCDYPIFEKESNLVWELQKKYSFDIHFVHAKNVYKDYIRVFKRSYEEAVKYQAAKGYLSYLLGMMRYYNHLLEEAIDGLDDKRLFLNIRNAITHNQIEFSHDQIKLYITGRNIHLKHYKKGSWIPKEFKNNRIIWEMIMNYEEFLQMLDELFSFRQIPTTLHLSK